jgi:hypothetical protein
MTLDECLPGISKEFELNSSTGYLIKTLHRFL